MSDKSRKTWGEKWITLAMGLIAIGLLGWVSVPSWRASWQAYWIPPARQVLSIASGNLLNNGSFVKAIKYQTPEGILVEILSSDEAGARSLVDRITIPGEHDGYFDFYGEASQLAILDINEDGEMELVAPSFDKDLIAHLNIFKYNPQTTRFEPLQAD